MEVKEETFEKMEMLFGLKVNKKTIISDRKTWSGQQNMFIMLQKTVIGLFEKVEELEKQVQQLKDKTDSRNL
ncbi:MAG: hypothetical protein HeimC3_53450 [Candidatus Heimdallarchaeota archaeon LC_3]|nr:MAG: hypothetical protein HeimC3_53450 [Candidatus Heimdallarchaeota archaeon LC_3]